MSDRRFRIFVPSAANLLTDHIAHGEGLLAWGFLNGLASRGHELVVCARKVDIKSTPPFRVIQTGRASHWESLEPFARGRLLSGIYEDLGGRSHFDLVHWFRPHRPIGFVPTDGVPFVIGPLSGPWPPEAPRTRQPKSPGDLVRRAGRGLFERWHRRALSAAVILCSTPTACESLPVELRAGTRVVPFGVDLSRFRPSPPQKTPTVLFLGVLEPKKGARELIQAFALARSKVPTARLLLVGDGPERQRISQLIAQLDLDGSTLLLDAVPHENVPALLEKSSLLCLPSYGEPFGMVVLEAMAAARAVVAADAGGPRFLVDRELGGRLVPLGSIVELGSALAELLSDETMLLEMGRFNRQRVEERFSLEHVLDELEAVYAEAVA